MLISIDFFEKQVFLPPALSLSPRLTYIEKVDSANEVKCLLVGNRVGIDLTV